MNRRQFSLFALASIATCSSVVAGKHLLNEWQKTQGEETHTNKPNNKHLFSAHDNEVGQHFIARLAVDGEISNESKIDSIQIPFRAHDTLALSQHKSLSFGRRPHNQMIVCDFETHQQQVINAKQGRHFYGHGCVDRSRNTLFTTENNFAHTSSNNNGNKHNHINTKGIIGIRDSQSFELLGEYESYGIGPHDIHLMPDNKTLVVANGGIQTHPDYGRRKLNIDTMQSSLVFIDIDTGKKIDEYRLDNHKLSIRHLTISSKGDIGIATQYQGRLSDNTPDFLVAYLGQEGLKTMNDSQQFTRDCHGYIGDVAMDSNAQILVASSPRGNNVSVWNIKQERLIKTIQMSGPSGLCFDQQNQKFLVSNEEGVIYTIPLSSSQPTSIQLSEAQLATAQPIATEVGLFPVKWDNHFMIDA